ncbi:hypothetical protein R5R35_010106 [Gryllus longicercus]|uniref:Uncharacterized protein n=1 Tax=Gryllus longicercus TaxID=2509291 RepID=A0AAN9Z7E5_9ORTH
MQLLTLNSLLMFDLVFVFFLFLVGVSCLVHYLPSSPAGQQASASPPPPPAAAPPPPARLRVVVAAAPRSSAPVHHV